MCVKLCVAFFPNPFFQSQAFRPVAFDDGQLEVVGVKGGVLRKSVRLAQGSHIRIIYNTQQQPLPVEVSACIVFAGVYVLVCVHVCACVCMVCALGVKGGVQRQVSTIALSATCLLR